MVHDRIHASHEVSDNRGWGQTDIETRGKNLQETSASVVAMKRDDDFAASPRCITFFSQSQLDPGDGRAQA